MLFDAVRMIVCVVMLSVIALPQTWQVPLFGTVAVVADDDDDDGVSDDDDDGPRIARRPAPPDHIPDEVLLINPSQADLTRTRALGFTAYATEIIGEDVQVVRLRLPPGLNAPAALQLLQREAPGATTELNHLYRLQQRAGNRDAYDCGTSRCYGQRLIGWSEALAACSSGLRIGMLDTGVDRTHPSLQGRDITSVAFAAPPALPSSLQHGTSVAALLAAPGSADLPGLLPNAQLFVADVFYAVAGGTQVADAVSIARGLNWLVGQSVTAINIALAGSENALVTRAVENAIAAGITIVAAVGNDGPDAPARHPAAIPGVIAVTAVDRRRRVYRRAAQGDHIAYAAPGVNVWTAQPRGRFGPATGTSYAAPFVTAVFAILRKENGKAAQPEVDDLGAPGPDPVFGQGLIRAPSRCGREISRN